MTENELLDLKKQIEEAKTQVAELEGTRKHLMKELKDDWGCGSVEEAEKKLNTMESDLDKLRDKINKGIEELTEKYDLETLL